MVLSDIRTRVELKNETVREKARLGTAGKVALIGAFPSSKQKIFAATSFSQIVSHYNVKLNSTAMKDYGGVKAARRIFMDGITGYGGASSISCVNICSFQPSKLDPLGDIYSSEEYAEATRIYDVDKEEFRIINGDISATPTNLTNDAIRNDVKLTFDKLKKALNQIADEDMDLLFIANDLWDVIDFPQQTYKTWTNDGNTYKIPIYKYIMNPDGTPTTKTETVNGKSVTVPVENTSDLVHYWDNSNKTTLKTAETLPENKEPLLHSEILNAANQVTNYEIKKDGNGSGDKIFFTEDMTDEKGRTVYGITPAGKYIRNIGDVYDYVLDFIDNEFTSHRPVNYIGAVFTRANVNEDTLTGIPSEHLRVKGKVLEDGEAGYQNPDDNPDNPYVNVEVWGANEIADLFTRETNELSTCGLFCQRGIINKEEVDEIELAAHMCGFICSIPINQDLTYQTIPGLTAVSEELTLGTGDAGSELNEHGIQVIRPKDRLAKTFYVNNSSQPTGWHTNHVRCVTYLLKRLQFENGLGINNILTNLEAYRAMLETVSKEVMEECDVIRSVVIGDIEIISHYHIFVPINILLAGVVTRINIGVSMALDEDGSATTYLKTTTGYSVTV